MWVQMVNIPGINIQWPWSQKLLSGEKTIETRSYPIPAKYIGKELALIETPGPLGKRNGISKSRIIGTITFSSCKKYETKESWLSDQRHHLVSAGDSCYDYDAKVPKWGWIVSLVIPLKETVSAPLKRGIVFATKCSIPEKIIGL